MLKEADGGDLKTAFKFSESEFFPRITEGILFQVPKGNGHMRMKREIPEIGIEQIKSGAQLPYKRSLHGAKTGAVHEVDEDHPWLKCAEIIKGQVNGCKARRNYFQ